MKRWYTVVPCSESSAVAVPALAQHEADAALRWQQQPSLGPVSTGTTRTLAMLIGHQVCTMRHITAL